MMLPRPAGPRILLVEDDYYQAKELKQLLLQAGVTVLGPTAEHAEVIDVLQQGRVDLAVLDINLGQGASFSIASLLHERDIPFLFLTGYDRAQVPDDFAAVPILQKPADEREILSCLAVHAVRGQVRQQTGRD